MEGAKKKLNHRDTEAQRRRGRGVVFCGAGWLGRKSDFSLRAFQPEDEGEVLPVEHEGEGDEGEGGGVAAREAIGGAAGADEGEQRAGGATEAAVGLGHKERGDEADGGDGERGDAGRADDVGGEGFEAGEVEGNGGERDDEREEEKTEGEIFESANDGGGEGELETGGAEVREEFLGGAVGAEVVAVERFSGGERNDEGGGGEEDEAGCGGPREAGARPADEEFLGEEIAGDEADVEDERELVGAFPAVTERGRTEGHEGGGEEDEEEAGVVPAEAEGRACGEFVAAELEAGFDALGDGHASHRRAGDAFDAGGFEIEVGGGVPGQAVPFFQKAAVEGDVVDVAGGVIGGVDFEAEDFPVAVEDDEGVGDAGVAEDVAAGGLGADDVAEFAAGAIEDEEAVAGGVVGAECGRGGEERGDLGGGDRGVALNALAHGDVADEPGDGGDDGEAVELEGEAFH